ncbi:MAG: KH domain-containing protein [Elusimicrobiota bacterium]|nr:KH domain-containing protein [Elusimicrobiota bacterium]
MKDLTLFIVKRLADKPESVLIEEEQDGDTTVLNLVVDETDKGKVIGKQGKVIKSIRTLVGVAAQKAGVRTAVEID